MFTEAAFWSPEQSEERWRVCLKGQVKTKQHQVPPRHPSGHLEFTELHLWKWEVIV